jgi:protein TonB
VDLGAYGRSIHRAVVKHRRYPRVARRLGLEGKVLIKISVDRQGRLLNAVIKRSSGQEILDKEALRMVRAAAPFTSLPNDFDKPSVMVVIPVKFKLQN